MFIVCDRVRVVLVVLLHGGSELFTAARERLWLRSVSFSKIGFENHYSLLLTDPQLNLRIMVTVWHFVGRCHAVSMQSWETHVVPRLCHQPSLWHRVDEVYDPVLPGIVEDARMGELIKQGAFVTRRYSWSQKNAKNLPGTRTSTRGCSFQKWFDSGLTFDVSLVPVFNERSQTKIEWHPTPRGLLDLCEYADAFVSPQHGVSGNVTLHRSCQKSCDVFWSSHKW